VAALLSALLLGPLPAMAQRTALKPGWNLLSTKQDVEMGQQAAKEAEQQLAMLRDARVDSYLNKLGRKLAAKAPGEQYPYQYKCVNDRVINAFALPGGFVYINRGVIETADNEAQLAAVMGHETSHVALRHGTNQASKAYVEQNALAMLGGMLGQNMVGSLLQMAGGFAANSLLLKYSRTAESQADIMGTQIIYDNGYDPRAMAQFLEKLEGEERKNGRPLEFFSNHPSPEHRVERVMEEVDKLGGPPANYKTDSPEFQEIKRHLLELPPPPKGGKGTGGSAPSRGTRSGGKPAPPSSSLQSFENDILVLRYPENWQTNGQGSAVSLVPDGGVVNDGRGNASLAWGTIVNVYEPKTNGSGNVTLQDATDQLLEDLRHNNPSMRVQRRAEPMRLGSEKALSMYLTDDSPKGGKETVWLVTALRPEGLVHLICVAPQNDYDEYSRAFETIVSSVRFRSN
jgi:Zn-dependent protease with chaperone function